MDSLIVLQLTRTSFIKIFRNHSMQDIKVRKFKLKYTFKEVLLRICGNDI